MNLLLKVAAAALVLYVLASWLLARYRNYLAATVSLLVPALSVLADVGMKCDRNAVSEACVWGKSLLPLTVGTAVALGTPLLYLVLTAVTRAWIAYRNPKAARPDG